MEVGDTVKFRQVIDPGDAELRMKVLEVNPPRCLVEAIVDMPIKPTARYPIADLEVVPPQEVAAANWVARNCKFAQQADPEQVISQCEKVQAVLVHLLDMVKGDSVAMPKMNQAWDLISEVHAEYYMQKKVTDVGSPT